VTGRRSHGYIEVHVLRGSTKWIPETAADSAAPTLCVPQAIVMRTCGESGDAAGTPAFEDPLRAVSEPLFAVPRGDPVRVWDYFIDTGRWALVERDGQFGFVRSADLCHTASSPPGSEATRRFHMRLAPAGPSCYQSHRARGASEIRRIIIHNSENTIQSAIATFQACDAGRPTSAHVGIDRDGTMYRFVEDRYAAFHTGGNDGGFNADSLGIELMASGRPGAGSMTPRQERAMVDLIQYWTRKYRIALSSRILSNSTRVTAYNDLEFWYSPVTIHRLASAGRRTDCPTFVWPDSLAGDDAFFRWRRARLH